MHLCCTMSGLQLPNPFLESFSNQTVWESQSFTLFLFELHLSRHSEKQHREVEFWSGLHSIREKKERKNYCPGREKVGHPWGQFLELGGRWPW